MLHQGRRLAECPGDDPEERARAPEDAHHAHVGVDLTDSRQARQRLASAKKPGGGGRHPRVRGEDAAQLDPPRRLVANP